MAAVNDQPVAGGSVSQPIAGGTISTPTPVTETAIIASDTYISSTSSTTTTNGTSETLTPPTPITDLRPAAPSESTIDPSFATPLLTTETAPPDIYPVGPEVVMYALALVASQLYFFRRRILKIGMNQ